MTDHLSFDCPTPLAYFAALVRRDEQLPLLEAAAALAQDDCPGLDLQQVLGDVDLLAARLARRVARDAGPIERLRALGRFFYGDLGFAGNLNNYYDPENSYLHRVLATRRGIPISLAVLWLELAQGLGLNAAGASFPGHFLVTVRLHEGLVVLDPLSGQSLSRDTLIERLEPFLPFQRASADIDPVLRAHLEPASARHIVARMLRNLQDIHRVRADWRRLVAVQDRLIVLLPRAWEEYRDRGLALAELGQTERARADLRLYLREAGEAAADREAMRQRLASLGE